MATELNDLGARLAAVRAMARELSARELDRLAGVAMNYAAMIESGERKNVGAAIVAAYARVLGTTTDYLILGTGDEPKERTVRASVERARDAAKAA